MSSRIFYSLNLTSLHALEVATEEDSPPFSCFGRSLPGISPFSVPGNKWSLPN